MWGGFAERDFVAIAIAQEDKDLESHGRFLGRFKEPPPFEIVADVDRGVTTGYDRATTYLIDKEGVVRQVFPQMVTKRVQWDAVLREAERLGLE